MLASLQMFRAKTRSQFNTDVITEVVWILKIRCPDFGFLHISKADRK
jgi:hypothetical protein